MRVRLLPASGKPFKSANQTFELEGQNTHDWKTFEAVLKIPENTLAQRMTIEFLGIRGAECEAFIDDVKLIKQSTLANVIFNSSFEICTVPGCPDRWISSVADLSCPEKYNTVMVSDTARTGVNSIKMSWHAPWDKTVADYSRLMSGYYTYVDEGKKYTLSLWMKTNNPPVKMTLRLMIPENEKTFVVDSKEWKQYTFTSVWRDPKKKTAFAFILLFFAGKKGELIDADVWVDDIMAQPGEIANSWLPAPGDKLYLDKMFVKTEKKTLPTVKTGNLPEITAQKIGNEKIVIDGKFTEKAWYGKNGAECNIPFKQNPVSNSTNCTIAYDANYMYIALDAKRKTNSPKINSNSAFSDDWIEIFLDPNDSNSYYQLAINRSGKMFTAKCRFDPIAFEVPNSKGFELDYSWMPALDYAVSEDKNGWKAELRIPFNLFDLELAEKMPFKLNFFRVIPAVEEINCWSKPKKGFHDVPFFGTLTGLTPHRKALDLDFTNIKYLPSPDGKTVIGKLSLNSNDVIDNLAAEMVSPDGKVEQLSVFKQNSTYEIIIPLSPAEVLGKHIRFAAKTKDHCIQAFSKVELSKLLSLGVDSLVFQDEKYIPCLIAVNLPESELPQTVLEIAATERESGRKVAAKEFTIKSVKDIYRLPFASLKNGWYDVTVSFKLHGKVMAEEIKWTYLGTRKKDYVRISVEKMHIERNGKPFFMIGAFNVLSDPQCNIKILSQYKKYGCNTVKINLASYHSNYESFDFDLIFDEAEKAGLAVIVDMTELLALRGTKYQYSKSQKLDIIKSFVAKYKNRPNLLLYHGIDEPGVLLRRGRPFCEVKDLSEVYWLVKTIDPYHPFFDNLEPRTFAWGDLRFTDVFSYDCYAECPSPYETNMERILYYLREGEKCAVSNGKPMFNVIQFSTSTETVKTRLLRYNEQRCLAYLTILNGSNGIIFYSGLNWCEPKNEQLLSISKELEKLAPVLLGYEKQERIKTDIKEIEAKYFEYEGSIWIICAN
ncbi:MAG: sugar-binding protein, partial [Victivallaceae bacterium]